MYIFLIFKRKSSLDIAVYYYCCGSYFISLVINIIIAIFVNSKLIWQKADH